MNKVSIPYCSHIIFHFLYLKVIKHNFMMYIKKNSCKQTNFKLLRFNFFWTWLVDRIKIILFTIIIVNETFQFMYIRE